MESSLQPIAVARSGNIFDTWKPTRRAIAAISAGTTVEVLEYVIVVDQPDVVKVTESIDELNLKSGDEFLRYAYLAEGWADLWVNGCWYQEADAHFIVEHEGGGCGGLSKCSARVTKPGKQTRWFRIKLSDGKSGWTQSRHFDLAG